jgi:hypothetical protein
MVYDGGFSRLEAERRAFAEMAPDPAGRAAMLAAKILGGVIERWETAT